MARGRKPKQVKAKRQEGPKQGKEKKSLTGSGQRQPNKAVSPRIDPKPPKAPKSKTPKPPQSKGT